MMLQICVTLTLLLDLGEEGQFLVQIYTLFLHVSGILCRHWCQLGFSTTNDRQLKPNCFK